MHKWFSCFLLARSSADESLSEAQASFPPFSPSRLHRSGKNYFIFITTLWCLLWFLKQFSQKPFQISISETAAVLLLWWTVGVLYKARREEWVFLSQRCNVYFCVLPVLPIPPLTFKLLPRCGPGDEQKCHCVMTNKQCLYPILIPLFIGQKKKEKKRKGPFAF